MVKQRKRILENFCGINYLMCSMIKKNSKISTLLTSLRQKGQITKDSPNQQISNWILVGNVKKQIRNELNSNKLSLRIAEKALGYGFSGLDRK